MITKDDINEKDMIDAINEIEVLYRAYTKKLDHMDEHNYGDNPITEGEISAYKEILGDIKVILDLLEQKKYKKPEIVK
tara:strand:- start:214 stop:447 length:234 start_codon:yes stop_codon:yes gene_type:complete